VKGVERGERGPFPPTHQENCRCNGKNGRRLFAVVGTGGKGTKATEPFFWGSKIDAVVVSLSFRVVAEMP